MTMAHSSRWIDRVRAWAKSVKVDTYAIYLAARDPCTPWYAKMCAILVAAYALSPIDLIPDFIPVLGYLDDLVVVPLGIMLVVRLIPPEIMAKHRCAAAQQEVLPRSKWAAAAIVFVWICAAGVTLWFLLTHFGGPDRGLR